MSKIYLRDLECYKNLSDEQRRHKLYMPDRAFDVDQLPTKGLRDELSSFIVDRGKKLTFLSIRADLYPFNQICHFISQAFPSMNTFVGCDYPDLERRCRVWLMKNGKRVSYSRIRSTTGEDCPVKSDVISYLKKVYDYYNLVDTRFRYDSDIWYLASIPLVITDNPIRCIKSISFAKISQKALREEIKKALYAHLSQKSLGTVLAELTAVNRFSSFLKDRHSEVSSVCDIDRQVLEDYLEFLRIEAHDRKSYGKDLIHLKTVLLSVGTIQGLDRILFIFQPEDIDKGRSVLYKTYSDNEIKRLNEAIVQLNPQIGRILFLHQLLGTRISETLTLKRDCLYLDEQGRLMIRIWQIKTKKALVKPVSHEIQLLIERACAYTQEKYGDTEYIFVRDSDPTKPMTYSYLQGVLMRMITKYELKDDNGVRFGIGTHIWRHNYAKNLAELDVNDKVIALLMGQSGTGSLKNYRRIGNKSLAENTEDFRKNADDFITEITKEWDKPKQ